MLLTELENFLTLGILIIYYVRENTKDPDQTWHLPSILYSMVQNYSHEEP